MLASWSAWATSWTEALAVLEVLVSHKQFITIESDLPPDRAGELPRRRVTHEVGVSGHSK